MNDVRKPIGIRKWFASILLGVGLAAAGFGDVQGLAAEVGDTQPAAKTFAQPGGGTAPLGRLPLAFVENRGQWQERVKFMVRQGKMLARLEPDRVSLALQRAPAEDEPRGTVVHLIFEGAHEEVVLEGKNLQRGKHNFFVGSDRSKWRAGVAAYSSVLYRGLYDGIDLRVRESGGAIEYDLLVAPGTDLGGFVIRCEGINGLAIDEEGSLVLETTFGPLHQKPPIAWQETADGERISVKCRFRQLDATRYTFEVPEHDPAESLVIDPRLLWSTYLGGLLDDMVNGIEVDSSGKVYLTGGTWSDDFPMTSGVYDEIYNGGRDVYVVCMDPTLTGSDQLLWATYLGGSGDEGSNNLALDTTGAVTIAGHTTSSDLPATTGAFDTTFNGIRDAFAARLDPNLSGNDQLLWLTYLGGSDDDFCGAFRTLALSLSGEVLLTGYTTSTDFPMSTDAYDQTYNGGDNDAFVTRLDPAQAGSAQLVYSTYLGGSATEGGQGIAVDDAGLVTIAGWTDSVNFPSTAGAFDETHNGGSSSYLTDAFISRLDPSLSGSAQLVYSTFYGGTGGDGANTLGMDEQGVVTITGSTESSDLPMTTNAYDTTFNGPDWDAFVVWINPAGTGSADLVYATYLGGAASHDYGYDLVVDSNGVAILTGITSSANFPTTRGAYDQTQNGWQDLFVTCLAPTHSGAADLLYSSFLGGTRNDGPWGIALDESGQPVVGGRTYSFNFPTTDDAYAETKAGGSDHRDGFVTKLNVLVPDIKANGSDGPVTVSQGSPLDVEITLDPGTFVGKDADWWLIATSPFGWYRYKISSGSWVSGFDVTYQAPLLTVDPLNVYSGSSLPKGTYMFYFGVDTNMNGIFDGSEAIYDSVEVTIV